MDRTAATTYLTNEFSQLATEVSFTSDQLATAYSTATDMALRQLGYAETALATTDVPQGQVMGYLKLLEYYVLKRFARVLSIRVQVTLPGPTTALRQQAFAQVKALLADVEADLVKLGVDLGGTWQMGRINLDFLEPGTVDEFGVPPVGWFWW